MQNILEAIAVKISEVKELNYIDEDWGQLDKYSQSPPVQWPCCLIDISSANYSNIRRNGLAKPVNRQMGQLSIRFTLANLKLGNSSLNAPQEQKEQAWSIWGVVQQYYIIYACEMSNI